MFFTLNEGGFAGKQIERSIGGREAGVAGWSSRQWGVAVGAGPKPAPRCGPPYAERFLYGPRFFGGGVCASIKSTIHSMSCSVSLKPASIAGDTLMVLCLRQKL